MQKEREKQLEEAWKTRQLAVVQKLIRGLANTKKGAMGQALRRGKKHKSNSLGMGKGSLIFGS